MHDMHPSLSTLSNILLKPLLHVETFSWKLCATEMRKMFQQSLHRVTWLVSWIFFNFCCETSFTKSRTAFYFCNSRNDRSGDKNASFTVSHHFVKLVRNAVAHKFQLKVSMCNSRFTPLFFANLRDNLQYSVTNKLSRTVSILNCKYCNTTLTT